MPGAGNDFMGQSGTQAHQYDQALQLLEYLVGKPEANGAAHGEIVGYIAILIHEADASH